MLRWLLILILPFFYWNIGQAASLNVDEHCDLNNVETQCREKFKTFLKKQGCTFESQPMSCDLEDRIKKLGRPPAKFTCTYRSSNCYTTSNSTQSLCEPGFVAITIPKHGDTKLCAPPPRISSPKNKPEGVQ